MVFLFPTLLLLLLLGFPIFISLGLASMSIFTFKFSHIPLVVVIQRMFAGMDNFAIMSMPFFILAANVAARGELSKRILNLAECMVGHFHGGLALTGILACMFFGAVSGSSPATVVAIGSLVYPILLERGYARDFSLGLVTSSSAVAIIIPPSITMILYAVVSGESVGALFMSGFGAGLTYGLCFMAYSVYYARKYKISAQPRANLKKVFDVTLSALWALGLPIIIVGGIYGGIFTPTEAGGVSAVYAIVIEIFVYKSIKLNDVFKISIDSAITTAQVYILVAAGTVFAWLLIVSQTPQVLTNFVNSLHASRVVILVIINFVFLIAGMFIDPSSIIVVFTPLFLPIALSYGISSLHLGIIVTVNIAIGMFSPPFGLNLFVASGLFKVSIDELVPGLIPFIVMSIIGLMILTYVPQISLWLPEMVYSFK